MGEKYQFTAVITGDMASATAKITAQVVDGETGEAVRDLPGRDTTYTNIPEAAFEVGEFFTGFGLSVGRRVALGSGDIAAAIALTGIAERLGIQLPPLDDDLLVASLAKASESAEQTPTAGAAEAVKAALTTSTGAPGDGSNN